MSDDWHVTLMASAASLPIINISPFLKDDRTQTTLESRKSAATALHSACVNFGFFYLDVSAFVDPREPEELVQLARKFFALPQDEKDKISLNNEDGARGVFRRVTCLIISRRTGYARLKENVTNGKADNHEGLDFYRPVENPDKTRPLWGENQWPTIPEFRVKYEQWTEKMKTLGLIVMKA